MRIGTYTPLNGRVRDILINRPVHKILFKLKGSQPVVIGAPLPFYDEAPMVLRIDMQDNVNAGTTSIVPHVNLSTLSEISSRREGFCFGRMDGGAGPGSRISYHMSYPVTLAPAGNMDLDANKFLLCELSDLPDDVEEVEVYGIELDTPSAILVQYNKFNIAKGINRQQFAAQGQMLVLPTEGFEEVQITYFGGVVTTKTLYELEYLTAINNDIVSAVMAVSSLGGGVMHSAVFGFRNALLLDLDGVQSFEIIRDNAQMSAEQFDLLMVDFGQDRLTDATMRRLAGGSFRAALNTDGTVSLIGAERIRVGNPLDQSITRLPAEALAMGGVSISALV